MSDKFSALGALRDSSVFGITHIYQRNGVEVKHPQNLDRQGIKASDTGRLGTLSEALAIHDTVNIVLQQPVEYMGERLVCLDLDWKHSPTGMPDSRQTEVLSKGRSLGLLVETSYSGKGAHVWFTSAQLPVGLPKVDNCEIEVFHGEAGHRKCVTLTMAECSGSILSAKPEDLGLGLWTAPVKQRGRPKKVTPLTAHLVAAYNEMLAHISPDDYADWVKVGMALKTTYGDAGFDLWDSWSQLSAKYDGGTLEKWDSFAAQGTTGSLVTAASIKTLAVAKGWQPVYTRDANGMITQTATNVHNYVEQLGIVYDEFSCSVFKTVNGRLVELRDQESGHLQLAMERDGFKPNVPIASIKVAMAVCAEEHTIDTGHEFAESLRGTWDGVDRCSNLFAEYFGVQDSAYTRACSKYFCVAMAGRLTAPQDVGFKADMIPVLISPQGMRKSSSIKALAPDGSNFIELTLKDSESDRARKQVGKVIIEMAELDGLYKSDIAEFKRWSAQTHDEWVPKFMEKTRKIARRFVLVGTTNEQQFLRDKTGNRRWLPMKLTLQEGDKLEVNKLEQDKLQIWAQSFEMLKELVDTESWHQDAERLAKSSGALTESEVTNDAADFVIEDIVNIILAKDKNYANEEDEFQLRDVMSSLSQDSTRMSTFRAVHKTGRIDHTIAACLRRLGFEYVTSRRSSDGKPAMRWRKV